MVSQAPHILAINDDQAILDLFREVLEEAGYQVSTRREHEESLAFLQAVAPDLVILDFFWSSDDGGWRFLTRLKHDPATAPIPVILCTGARRQVRVRQKQLAAMDVRVLFKPFDLDDLLGVVHDALAGAAHE